MAKATHNGTCQCCGSIQKLPNGVLSKHGYTVDYGWFNGTCKGAGHKPFEESTDLIDNLIELAQQRIDELNSQVNLLQESTDATDVWKHSYASHRHPTRPSGYFWEKKAIIKKVRESDGYEYWSWDDGKDSYSVNNNLGPCESISLEGIIKKENGKYVDKLQKETNQTKHYIIWQRERCVNWKPQPLLEIK